MPRLTNIALLLAAIFFVGCGSKDNGPVAPTVPSPSELRSTFVPPASIRLNWSDNSPNEQGFRVDRAPTGGTNYTHLPNLPANTETFVDTGLTEGSTYDYRVVAFNGPTASPSELLPVAVPLLPPTGLRGQRNSTTSVRLTWTDASSNESGYQVDMKIRNVGEFVRKADLEANTGEYMAEGLTPRTSYQFRVRAAKDTVGSAWSATVTVETTVLTPNPPSGLTPSTSQGRPNAVTLRWNDMSGNEDGFIIEMSLSEGFGWAPVDTGLADNDNIRINNLTAETVYFFRVYAYNGFGASEYSNVVSIEVPGPPVAPTGLTANAPDWRGVDLRWTDNSRNEKEFFVERRPSTNPNWSRITRTGSDTTLYFDNTVIQNLTYVYRVQASNDAGISPYSDEAEVTIPDGPPAGPIGLSANTLDIDKIIVAWNDLANNELDYFLERKLHDAAEFDLVGVFPANTNIYTDTSLTPETAYDYRVYCTNLIGQSPYSNVATASTLSLTILTDSFENYQTAGPPGNPWTVTQVNPSTAEIVNNDAHAGIKSLQFNDGSAEATAYAMATASHRRIKEGIFEAWVKLAPSGYFGIQTIGGNIYCYQIQFESDGRVLCRNGRGANAFQYATGNWMPNQWMHVMVEFNVDSNRYNVSIDDNLIAENFAMQDSVELSIDKLRLLVFSGASIAFARVDEATVSFYSPEHEAPPFAPRRPEYGAVDFVRDETIPIIVR